MNITTLIILLRLRKILFFHQSELSEIIGEYRERINFLNHQTRKGNLQNDGDGNYSLTIQGKATIERYLKAIDSFR